jgi:hypothetical protein
MADFYPAITGRYSGGYAHIRHAECADVKFSSGVLTLGWIPSGWRKSRGASLEASTDHAML